VAPSWRHQAPDAATLLVDQDQDIMLANGLLGLGDQPSHLIGRLAVPGEEDEPARPHVREKPRLIGCQVWPRKTSDEGSTHCRRLYRPVAEIAAGHVDAKTGAVRLPRDGKRTARRHTSASRLRRVGGGLRFS